MPRHLTFGLFPIDQDQVRLTVIASDSVFVDGNGSNADHTAAERADPDYPNYIWVLGQSPDGAWAPRNVKILIDWRSSLLRALIGQTPLILRANLRMRRRDLMTFTPRTLHLHRCLTQADLDDCNYQFADGSEGRAWFLVGCLTQVCNSLTRQESRSHAPRG